MAASLLSFLLLAVCLADAVGIGAGAHGPGLRGEARRQVPHMGLRRLRRSTAAVASSDFSVNQLYDTCMKVRNGIVFTFNIFNPCKPYGVVDCEGLCASAKKQVRESTEEGIQQLKDCGKQLTESTEEGFQQLVECGKQAQRQLLSTGESLSNGLSKLFVTEPSQEKRGKTRWEDGDPIMKAKSAKQMSLKK